MAEVRTQKIVMARIQLTQNIITTQFYKGLNMWIESVRYFLSTPESKHYSKTTASISKYLHFQIQICRPRQYMKNNTFTPKKSLSSVITRNTTQPCCARPGLYHLLFETLFETWKKNVIGLIQFFLKVATYVRRFGQFILSIFFVWSQVIATLTVSRLNNLCSRTTVQHQHVRMCFYFIRA